jgi:hypothetical protein
MAMAVVGICTVGHSCRGFRGHFAFSGILAARDRRDKGFGNGILFIVPFGTIGYVFVFSFASLVCRVFGWHAFEF